MADGTPSIDNDPVATPSPLDGNSPTNDARGASDTGAQYQTPEEQLFASKASPDSVEESDDIPFAEPVKTHTINLEDEVEWKEQPNTSRQEKATRTDPDRPTSVKPNQPTAERARSSQPDQDISKPPTSREGRSGKPRRAKVYRLVSKSPSTRGVGLVKWVAMLILLALVGGGGYWGYWYFTEKDAPTPVLATELPATSLLALMPADVREISYEKTEKVSGIAKFQPMAEKQFKRIERLERFALPNAGLGVNHVHDIMEGITESFEPITVIRLKSPIGQAKATSGATELKAGEKSYWRTPRPSFIAFPTDTIVLITSKEETMTSILGRNAEKPVIADQLQDLVKLVDDGDRWLVRLEPPSANKPGMDKVPSSGPIGNGTRFGVSNQSLDIDKVLVFANANAAADRVSEIKKEMDQRVRTFEQDTGRKVTAEQRAAFKKMMAGAKVEQNGTVVRTAVSLDLDPFTPEDIEGELGP